MSLYFELKFSIYWSKTHIIHGKLSKLIQAEIVIVDVESPNVIDKLSQYLICFIKIAPNESRFWTQIFDKIIKYSMLYNKNLNLKNTQYKIQKMIGLSKLYNQR